MTILMVVGGNNAENDVELIDLTGQGRTCRKPDNYPGAARGSVGSYLGDNDTYVCGGEYPNVDTCFNYDPEDGSWTPSQSMNVQRGDGASVVIQDKWWITGGYFGTSIMTESTEFYDPDSQSFTSYVDLPEPRSFHDMVSFNDSTSVMLLCGYPGTGRTYQFDVNEETWKSRADLITAREDCEAGHVTFSDGREAIVVTSGIAEISTEILYLDEDDGSWTSGPDLPYEIWDAQSVQWQDTFLIVGGFGNTGVLDTIWRFNVDDSTWVLMDQKLATGRNELTAFLVPDIFC